MPPVSEVFSLPAWTGLTFTKTTHHTVPPSLTPSSQSLPSPFVAVITGASRGLGAATAKAYAAAGATGLILTARTTDALQKTHDECKEAAKDASIKISLVAADAAEEGAAKRVRDVVEKEHGRLDLLINNAGLLSTHESAFQRIEGIEGSQIQDIINVNYVGRFHMVKYLLPLLLSTPNGAKAIINVTSLASHFAAHGAIGFNISAFATNRFTEVVADSYKDDGILAYAVHPGMVLTTPPPGFPKEWATGSHDDVGLCGGFCVWLTKERREWLSGRYVSVNWDIEELEGMKEEIVGGDKLKMRMVV